MCLYCRTSQSLYYALYMYVGTFQERIESAVSFFTGISLGIDVPYNTPGEIYGKAVREVVLVGDLGTLSGVKNGEGFDCSRWLAG